MNRLIALAVSLLFLQPAAASLVVLDKIIAVVDDDVVMESELELRKQAIQSQLQAANQRLPPEDVLEDQIVERLVLESLQLQMAERAGVRISDEELNDAMNRIAAQNNTSLAQFRQAIEQDGISYVSMREQVRREMAMTRVQQGVLRNRIRISEQEIRDFLASELGSQITADEYRLAHILLSFPEDPGPDDIRDVKAKADAILQELNEGADFQSLAIAKSEGSDAIDGGDLGWRKAVTLPTMFASIAPEMAVGEIKGPIRSGSGFHVVKLINKRGAKTEGQVPQTQVRHILITPSEIRTDEESRDFAESLRREIVEDGRPFEELAKLHSDDPGSALDGGDLGWSRAGIFVPEFENMMDATEIGEVSPVFKSSHGYHFLEVTGRRIEDFSERFKMGQAENYLRNQKWDEELESWLREIRDEAFVEIRI